MVGIISYGVYIPKYRLPRELIAKAWGTGSISGEKAIANYDEDALTMAVEAAFNCIEGRNPKTIDDLFIASTTTPYKEKMAASIIAATLDLRNDVFSTDFSNSLRSGASAIKASVDAVKSSSAKQSLVAIADCRLGSIGSELEQSLGDGAAAFLIGDTDVIANIVGDYSVSDDFLDYWRKSEDLYVQYWESRYAIEAGYTVNMEKAAKGIMDRLNLKPADFSKVVLYAPDMRRYTSTAKSLGFDIKNQLPESIFNSVGNTGTAFAPMILVECLEESKPGDKILMVCYGDGAHAFVFEVTKNIEKLKDRRTFQRYLSSKILLNNYETYLRFRKLIPFDSGHAIVTPNSAPALWRGRKSFLSFYGSKCNKCNTIQHPIQRICFKCKSIDDYQEIALTRKGKIFSYSEDYVNERPKPPRIACAIILDDGTKIDTELIEDEAQKLSEPPQKLGQEIEMVFRRIKEASGFYDYYWKARIPRTENVK